MSIIIFILILIVLILAHEFGHFIVAKAFGIRVDEFGIGFPPKIWGKKFGETEYTVNWIPFGGFVKIFGEDIEDEEVLAQKKSISEGVKSRNFYFKPALVKGAVMFAGVFFNFLLAWVLFSIGYMSGLPVPVDQLQVGQVAQNVKLTIVGVAPDSVALRAGIKAGDTISAVSKGNEHATLLTPDSVRDFIAKNRGQELKFLITSSFEQKVVSVTPEFDTSLGRPIVGISMDTIGTLQLGFFEAVYEGGRMSLYVLKATALGFYNLIKNAIMGAGNFADVSGPIGIVKIVGDAAKFGFTYLLGLTAVISINLTVLNLLPVPALDGGRILFLIIEKIKRSPIKVRTANLVNTIGFYALILLMLVVTINDIFKLFR
ncbi:MAG: site-2 protease family protein [Candidatus Vogelbacteria bacterium]|nr:site-2 protease family protein [Candidatus Vogelbacteria bacterium]